MNIGLRGSLLLLNLGSFGVYELKEDFGALPGTLLHFQEHEEWRHKNTGSEVHGVRVVLFSSSSDDNDDDPFNGAPAS